MLAKDGTVVWVWDRDTVTSCPGAGARRHEGMLVDITASKNAEAALLRGQELHRSVIDALTEGVMVMLPNGEVASANPSAQQILGFDPTAGDPAAIWARVERYWEDGVPATGDNSVGLQVLATGEPARDVVMQFRRPDGELRWVSLNYERVTRTEQGDARELVVSFRDITARRRMTDELRRSDERLRTVVGNAPLILWAIDAEGRITLSEGRGLEARGLRARRERRRVGVRHLRGPPRRDRGHPLRARRRVADRRRRLRAGRAGDPHDAAQGRRQHRRRAGRVDGRDRARAGGAAAVAHGAARLADRAAQPLALPRPPGSRPGPGQARERALLRALHRPRPVQAHQRLAGPPRRRPDPAGDRRPHRPRPARRRHGGATGRRRVHRAVRGNARRGPGAADRRQGQRGARPPLRASTTASCTSPRRSGWRCRTRNRRPSSSCATRTPRCTGRRAAAARAPSCSTRSRAATPSTAWRWRARCTARSSATSSACSTSRRCRCPRAGRRLRGAAALGAPHARATRAGGVHPRRRGQRADRADRPLGAERGRAPDRRVGRPAASAAGSCA